MAEIIDIQGKQTGWQITKGLTRFKVGGHLMEVFPGGLLSQVVLVDWFTDLAWVGSWQEYTVGTPCEQLDKVARDMERDQLPEEIEG